MSTEERSEKCNVAGFDNGRKMPLKTGETKKWILPWSPRKECTLVDTLILELLTSRTVSE